MELLELDTKRMLFRSYFLGAENVGRTTGWIEVKIRWMVRRSSEARPMMVCPRCETFCTKIVMVAREWGCKQCHELCNVRTRLSIISRDQRRMKQLGQKVKAGRKKGQHGKKFEEIREEYGALFRRFYELPPLHPELGYFQTAQWLQVGDPGIFMEVPREFVESYLWVAGGTGGFKRLHWLADTYGRQATEAQIRRHQIKRYRAWTAFHEGRHPPDPKKPKADGTPAKGWATPGVRKRRFNKLIPTASPMVRGTLYDEVPDDVERWN